jgi:predicted lipoprotein with Yx(FWY)xxD motif
MKIRLSAANAARAAMIVVAAVGVAQGGTAAAAKVNTEATTHAAKAVPATVRIMNTLVGPLLVNQHGHTVFVFTKDKRRRDVCGHIKGCLKDWPVVTTTGKPIGGPGIKRSLLGTIPYHGKVREVTYAGHPLHTYRFDYEAGSVMNIGNVQFGGSWFALNAAGSEVK